MWEGTGTNDEQAPAAIDFKKIARRGNSLHVVPLDVVTRTNKNSDMTAGWDEKLEIFLTMFNGSIREAVSLWVLRVKAALLARDLMDAPTDESVFTTITQSGLSII